MISFSLFGKSRVNFQKEEPSKNALIKVKIKKLIGFYFCSNAGNQLSSVSPAP